MAGHSHFPQNIDKIVSSKNKKTGVWQRKTDSEVEQVKQKLRSSSFNVIMPIGIFIFGLIASYSFIPETQNKIIYCIILPLCLFIITYLYQIFSGRALASSPTFKICNKCHKEDRIGLKECSCGGRYEPPEFYNFIDE